MKVHIVLLSSTVIFTAVSYDVINSHWYIKAFTIETRRVVIADSLC